MLKSGESSQNLLANIAEGILPPGVGPVDIDLIEKPLGPVEKTFLLHAERGDCATVRQLIREYKDNPAELDINCVDPLNRSALIAAIENGNIELIRLLLEENIKVKDGLLYAIKEEYIEAVELLLQYEEQHHQPGEPYSWEAVDRGSSTFTSDITPLILAAHKNNYEIIKILLDRGASLPMPHDVRCGCDECVESSSVDSLCHSQARINAYRALTSASLISLSSKDPLLTAFELSWELRRLSRMEQEFRAQYNEMRNSVQKFATSLLDHARTSYELEIMLNYDPEGTDTWDPGEHQTLERLKLALKYKQKQFVAHPSVQQLLATIWYEGLPGFRRKSAIGQILQVAKLGCMFPVYCTIYMLSPESEMGKFMKKPFVKFICHSSSYALFLVLLGSASQRVEINALEWLGNDWMQEIVADWKRKERGAGPGIAECGVIIYMISLIWGEIRSLWHDGLLEYISDLWNVVDFITNMFYVLWLAMRCSSFYIVWKEAAQGRDPWYPREQWDMFDPMLLSEGAFAAGMIFSFLKLVHIFSINPHMGPLQISLGRMIIDIVKFFFIYTLVLFAFGCGLNQLLWYYAELEKHKCYHLPSGLPDFDNADKACSIWRRYANLFETSQSLFWASFGLVDLVSFELSGIKGFTRFWALLMFGSYSVINVIVLLNMLIAMMSNSYQIISERSDSEWKFARSKLWISYFDDGDTLPPPFNLFPTAKQVFRPLGLFKKLKRSHSVKRKSRELAMTRHLRVMRLLVRRYVTAEQRKRDDFGITEDDVIEIRQDISTLRYELIDILRSNGMQTPKVSSDPGALAGKKGKVMERRLLKDFHIGIVEAAVTDAVSNIKEPKDIFGTLARVIGRRSSSKSSKKDWNALVRRNTTHRDPIGSSQEAEAMRANRQSLRRHILNTIRTPVEMDQEKLLEYNPKLVEVPKSARVAYAKFMSKKIQSDYSVENEVEKSEESEAAKAGRKSTKGPAPKPTVKFKGEEATAASEARDGGSGGGGAPQPTGSTARRVDTESKITSDDVPNSSKAFEKLANTPEDSAPKAPIAVKKDEKKEIIMDAPIRDAKQAMKPAMTPTTVKIEKREEEMPKEGKIDARNDAVEDQKDIKTDAVKDHKEQKEEKDKRYVKTDTVKDRKEQKDQKDTKADAVKGQGEQINQKDQKDQKDVKTDDVKNHKEQNMQKDQRDIKTDAVKDHKKQTELKDVQSDVVKDRKEQKDQKEVKTDAVKDHKGQNVQKDRKYVKTDAVKNHKGQNVQKDQKDVKTDAMKDHNEQNVQKDQKDIKTDAVKDHKQQNVLKDQKDVKTDIVKDSKATGDDKKIEKRTAEVKKEDGAKDNAQDGGKSGESIEKAPIVEPKDQKEQHATKQDDKTPEEVKPSSSSGSSLQVEDKTGPAGKSKLSGTVCTGWI